MSHLYHEGGDDKNRSKGPVACGGKNGFRTLDKTKAPGKRKPRVVYMDDESDSRSSSNETSESEADVSSKYSSSDAESSDSFEVVQSTKRPRSSCKENGSKRLKRQSESSHQGDDEEEEYSVEEILDMVVDKAGQQWFHIKWWNYDSKDNTWEPIENLSKCLEMVEEFLEKRKKAKAIAMNATGLKVMNLKNHSAKENCRKNGRVHENGKSPSSSSPQLKKSDLTWAKMQPSVKLNKVEVTSRPPPNKKPIIENTASEATRTHIVKDTTSNTTRSPIIVDISSSPTRNSKVEDSNFIGQHTETNNNMIPDPLVSIKINPGVLELAVPSDFVRLAYPGSLYYFKIVNDGEYDYLLIDYTKPLSEEDADDYYKCVVTEDLTGKEVKLLYGATKSVDGHIFCLVQFEGYSYVEIIPPENLFKKYPTFRRYFEVHCPHLFSTSS